MTQHEHAGGPRSHTAGAGQGPVAIEVGVDVGTLLVWAPAELAGVELDITRYGEHDQRHHVAVLARRLPERTAHAAVYPGLPAGRYQVWGTEGRPVLSVHVPGGVVTEVTWPGTEGVSRHDGFPVLSTGRAITAEDVRDLDEE